MLKMLLLSELTLPDPYNEGSDNCDKIEPQAVYPNGKNIEEHLRSIVEGINAGRSNQPPTEFNQSTL